MGRQDSVASLHGGQKIKQCFTLFGLTLDDAKIWFHQIEYEFWISIKYRCYWIFVYPNRNYSTKYHIFNLSNNCCNSRLWSLIYYSVYVLHVIVYFVVVILCTMSVFVLQDTNLGLAKQCLSFLYKKNIQRLTKVCTFVLVSIKIINSYFVLNIVVKLWIFFNIFFFFCLDIFDSVPYRYG